MKELQLFELILLANFKCFAIQQVGAQVGGPEVEEKVHVKEVTEEDKLKDIDAVLGRLAKGRVVKVTSTALSITANATWGT